MALLKLTNVTASYGVVRALRGISLEVSEGAIVTVLGANGAGKSTTLKCVSGVVPLQQGSIEFAGRSIGGLAPNQIVKLGIVQVPEGRKIFKELTVLENLTVGAYTRSDRANIARDLEFVLTMFPVLKDRIKQLGGSLSGGEQQMLAIGRGLMARPKLLLLDEPSLGLAPIVVSNIFQTLRQLNAEHGMTLVIIEQNMHVALSNASYGYVLQLGRVAVEGEAGELKRNSETFKSYLGSGS
jgi:branched-chain amino acid transport system ATP-binding protein